MSKRSVYVLGPDGRIARDVGPWVARKDHYVDRFASMFAAGMRHKWKHRAYIELFAGPGMSHDRSTGQFVTGSAIRALSQPFTDYAFVDRDRAAIDALAERASDRGYAIPLLYGDCNDAVPALRRVIPSDALTLAFVDPTSWQVRLETIAALVEGRRVDLLMTFHAGSMRRMGLIEANALNAFFGTDAWRALLRRPRWERTAALLELYNRQLEQLGYLPSHAHHVPVVNSRGVAMYELVAFSKHPRGLDFWKKAIGGVDERGRVSLWDDR